MGMGSNGLAATETAAKPLANAKSPNGSKEQIHNDCNSATCQGKDNIPRFTYDPTQWESIAKAKLSTRSWGYLNGNGGTGQTYSKNLAAFDRWSILSRRLVPSRKDSQGRPCFSDTSSQVLGQSLPFPIGLAPIGIQTIFHEDGERATASAAASLGLPFTLSTVSSTSIEEVAAASDPHATRWFQLYWLGEDNKDITASLLRRAERAGYTALFVTLDTFAQGWRPSELDNDYDPFIGPNSEGVAVGFSDPAFRAKFREAFGSEADIILDGSLGTSTPADDDQAHKLGHAARMWKEMAFPGHSLVWSDIAFLQEHWHGPIVLKGIQTVADAEMCVRAGVQGIVVSNHGGRHQDGAVSSLGVLPGIARAVGDKLDIFFDSGVRCGADIIKALALGAKCVLIGRLYVYGLAFGGERGVRHVLRALMDDFGTNMHLAGLRSVSDIRRDILIREDELF